MDAPLRDLPRGDGGAGGLTEPVPVTPERPFRHLGRRLLIPLVLGLLALVGLALFADARELAARLRAFDLRLLAPVLALSLVNYALRFARWQLYLSALEVGLPRGRSLAVFLVGFLLSVTPGKAGELGKAWLVRELGGGPALRVVPAVLAVCERYACCGADLLKGIAAGAELMCRLALVALPLAWAKPSAMATTTDSCNPRM